MRFSEVKEVREIDELRDEKGKRSVKKSTDPVTRKLGLIKTTSPDALALKLRRR